MSNDKPTTTGGEMVVSNPPSNLPEIKIFDPEKEVNNASVAAKALTKVISHKPKKVVINNEQYIEYEDWQMIARFYNITVGTEWSKEILKEGKLFGYEAKAVVYNYAGVVIGSAEASCLRDERNWMAKPEFQLRSMAQTRACAKALRNVLGWVVVLAGYKATPSEEMDDFTNGGGGPVKSQDNVHPFPSNNGNKASKKQLEFIASLMKDCGAPEDLLEAKVWLAQKVGMDIPETAKDLTSRQASEIIDKLTIIRDESH